MDPKNYLIYCDLDGTMLTDWSLGPVFPANSRAAMDTFIGAGGAVSLATGRQTGDALAFFPGLVFPAPLVLCNGACIFDQAQWRTLEFSALPEEALHEAAAIAAGEEDIHFITADAHGMFQMDEGPEKNALVRDQYRRTLVPRSQIEKTPAAKMCFILSDPARMPYLRERVSMLSTAPQLYLAQSAPIYLEIMCAGVTKAHGVRRAAELAGLTNRTLVCFGDYENDYEMLRCADIAACPSNAIRQVQDICSIVTCSNNDGAFADLIARLP